MPWYLVLPSALGVVALTAWALRPRKLTGPVRVTNFHLWADTPLPGDVSVAFTGPGRETVPVVLSRAVVGSLGDALVRVQTDRELAAGGSAWAPVGRVER